MSLQEQEDALVVAKHQEITANKSAAELTRKSAETKGPTIWTKLAVLAGLIGLIWYSATHELVVVKAVSEDRALSGVPLLLKDGKGKVSEATTTLGGRRFFILNNEELDGAHIQMLPQLGNTRIVNGNVDGAVDCAMNGNMDVQGGCRTIYEADDVKLRITGFSEEEAGFWRTLTAEFVEYR